MPRSFGCRRAAPCCYGIAASPSASCVLREPRAAYPARPNSITSQATRMASACLGESVGHQSRTCCRAAAGWLPIRYSAIDWQGSDRFADPYEGRGVVRSCARPQAHLLAVFTGNDAIAVKLGFVQPARRRKGAPPAPGRPGRSSNLRRRLVDEGSARCTHPLLEQRYQSA
jgi:hypothetical protein